MHAGISPNLKEMPDVEEHWDLRHVLGLTLILTLL